MRGRLGTDALFAVASALRDPRQITPETRDLDDVALADGWRRSENPVLVARVLGSCFSRREVVRACAAVARVAVDGVADAAAVVAVVDGWLDGVVSTEAAKAGAAAARAGIGARKGNDDAAAFAAAVAVAALVDDAEFVVGPGVERCVLAAQRALAGEHALRPLSPELARADATLLRALREAVAPPTAAALQRALARR